MPTALSSPPTISPSRSSTRSAYVVLALIAAAGLAVRLWYLFGPASPGGEFAVVDPDTYTIRADVLARHGQGWAWSLDAVKYFQFVKAPLYLVFLAIVRLHAPGPYPFSATVAHAALTIVTIVCVFWIAARLHSSRAGLVAAALMAFYLPSVVGAAAFSQEALYIPLAMLACATLVDASARRASAARWALAGAAFGVAALTRSLAIYYVPLAALVVVAMSDRRSDAALHAAALLIGAAVVVLPYSAYISAQMGQVLIIENMGSIHFGVVYPDAVHGNIHTAPPPTIGETVTMFIRAMRTAPGAFVAERLNDLGGLFQMRGGRWLQLEPRVPDRMTAWQLKILAHVASDLPFVLMAVLAPIGWAVARRRCEATLAVWWILMNLGLVAAFTFSGARYRAPAEPIAAVFAGIALAGPWTRPRRATAVVALVATVPVAWAVFGSMPATAAAHAEYGVIWSGDHDTRHVRSKGEVGINAVPVNRTVAFTLALVDPPESALPAQAGVSVGGEEVATLLLTDTSRHALSYSWAGPGLAHLEVAVHSRSGAPLEFQTEVALPAAEPQR